MALKVQMQFTEFLVNLCIHALNYLSSFTSVFFGFICSAYSFDVQRKEIDSLRII